jgi:hypothetical protein
VAKPEILVALRCAKRDFDILDLDEAVILAGLGDSAVQAFVSRSLTVPDWLQNQQKALGRFIRLKHEEELELKLKRAEAARATHATQAERREQLDTEIAALRAELGQL